MKPAMLMLVLFTIIAVVCLLADSLTRPNRGAHVPLASEQRVSSAQARSPAPATRPAERQTLVAAAVSATPHSSAGPVERDQSPEMGEPSSGEMEVAISHVQATFTGQPPDAPWTREMRSRAEEVVRSAANEGSALRSVECRASICRIDIAHDGAAQYRDFQQHVRNFSDDEMAFTRSSEGPAEDWTMVVYVARPGTELPKLD